MKEIESNLKLNNSESDIINSKINNNKNLDNKIDLNKYNLFKQELFSIVNSININNYLNRISVGLASCGIASGAKNIYKLLDLSRKHKNFNLVETGCLGICFKEPLVDFRYYGISIVFGDFKINDIRLLLLDDFYKIIKELKHKIIGYYDVDDYYGYFYKKKLDNDIKANIFDKKSFDRTKLNILSFLNENKINKLKDHFFFKEQSKIITKNSGIINPLDLKEYILTDGFLGFVKALSMDRNDIINLIKESKLRGRGGAGFYTGLKWSFVATNHNSKKYLIANADEGDPGAFMNRNEMESDPFRLLEGMLIASYAMNIDEAIIYIRSEYPLAVERLKKAINILKENGLLGNNILNSDFSLNIYIKKGAGAYVCGEETALIKSIEGKRGMPKPKPPFPTDKGLFNKPTCINNVGTLCHVASIFQIGLNNYIKLGTENTKGTKVLCLTGNIKNTGVIEVAFGYNMKRLVDIFIKEDIKAIQMGGPSGGCIPYSELDNLTLDYETINKKGAIVGSGGIVFLNKETDMVKLAKYFISFANFESCGQCLPCREGNKRLLELLNKFLERKAKLNDLNRLVDLSNFIKTNSLCGLGKTSPNPILTTIKYFKEEYLNKIQKDQETKISNKIN